MRQFACLFYFNYCFTMVNFRNAAKALLAANEGIPPSKASVQFSEKLRKDSKAATTPGVFSLAVQNYQLKLVMFEGKENAKS